MLKKTRSTNEIQRSVSKTQDQQIHPKTKQYLKTKYLKLISKDRDPKPKIQKHKSIKTKDQDPTLRSKDRDPKLKIQKNRSNKKQCQQNKQDPTIRSKARDPKLTIQKK